jgi:hypothetical protein
MNRLLLDLLSFQPYISGRQLQFVPQKSFTNIDTLILDALRQIKLITLQSSNMKLFSLITTLLVCAPASSAKFGVIKPLQKLKANSPSVLDPFVEGRQSLAQPQSNALLTIRGGALGVTQDNALTGTFVVA